MAGWCPQNIVHSVPSDKMDAYFKTRHEQGFNIAWVLVSGWDDGLFYKNNPCVHDHAGNPILKDQTNHSYDPANLNPAYAASVDAMMDAAARNQVYLFLNVMNEPGQEFGRRDKAECFAWGKFWGDRYALRTHVLYMLGNDQVPQPQANWIVEGILSNPANRDRLFIIDQFTFNRKRGNGQVAMPNPWWQWKNKGATWINLWGWYSYESPSAAPDDHTTYQYSAWTMYTQAQKWGMAIAPTFMIEAEYTDYPISNAEGNGIPTKSYPMRIPNANERYTLADNHALRRQLWSAPLGGGTGWGIIGNINDAVYECLDTLNEPGIKYATLCKAFFTSRRWDLLAPDYDHAFLTSQAGDPGIHDPTYVSAALATDGSWGAVYYPGVAGNTNKLTIDLSKLGGGKGNSKTTWFDPSNGTTKLATGSPFTNTGTRIFTTPGKNSAGSADWVLVLDAKP